MHGTITASGIVDVGSGWYRVWISGTPDPTDTSIFCDFFLSDAEDADLSVGAPSYVGVGGKDAFVWGAQVELGSSPTSYIKTTTAAVTRAEDVATIDDVSFHNEPEGTYFTEFQVPNSSDYDVVVEIANGGTDRIIVAAKHSSSNAYGLIIIDGGVTLTNLSGGTVPNDTKTKVALGYKLNDVVVYADGVSVITDPGVTMPTVAGGKLYLGNNVAGSFDMTGHIARITYWPRRLANSILGARTSAFLAPPANDNGPMLAANDNEPFLMVVNE